MQMKRNLCPLSSEQARLWFECKNNPHSPAYSNPFNFELIGTLDFSSLKAAWNDLLKKYEILKSYIYEINSRPYQKISNKTSNPVKLIDLSNESQLVEKYISELNTKHFDINKPPLSSAILLKLNHSLHILHLNFHHLIIDGISLGYILEDLSDYYNQRIHKIDPNIQPVRFKPRKIGYDNMGFDYWNNRLKGANFEINLPKSLNISQAINAKSKFVHIQLTTKLSRKIRTFAKENFITLFQFIVGVTALISYKYTGQKNITLGYSVTTRIKSDIRQVGCFVNALPIHFLINEKDSILDLFKKINQIRKEDKQYQQTPLIEIIKSLRSNGSPEVRSLFNILINEKTYSSYHLDMSNITCTQLLLSEHFAKNDLTILFDDGENILLDFEYDATKFNSDVMNKFCQEFLALAEELLEKSYAQIDAFFNKINKNHRGLQALEGDFKKYPSYYTLPYLFQKVVNSTPNSIALIFQSQKITFHELDIKTTQLATYLLHKGVKTGDIIAVCFQRSVEMIYAILAIIKAGAAYLPIEPQTPIERSKFMIIDSSAKFLLSNSSLLHPELHHLAKTIFLDVLKYPNNLVHPLPVINDKNYSYLIYTSGSTGTPKGVLNIHQGTVNRLLWMKNYFKVSNQDNILLKTSYSFDVSVWEIFLPLITGAKLVILKPDQEKDPEEIIAEIIINNITILHFVPSMLHTMIEFSPFEKCISLRAVICSGEVLEKNTVGKFYKKSRAELYNLYGPTEASIDVTYWDCIEKEPKNDIPIGYAIDNVKLYIIDEQLNQVPAGLEGELCIGGIALAQGYINNVSLTNEKFIRVPFLNNEIIYRTGDRVSQLSNGALKFLGRLDRQVKLRGYRIELNEIESKIREINGVKEAAVILKERDGERIQKQLVAYILSGKKDIEIIITETLARWLPSYMTPLIIKSGSSLPKLPNGKIDYKKLSAKDIPVEIIHKDEIHVINENYLRSLSTIWKDVLKTNTISQEENFFSLGGSSLNIIELLYFIDKKFSIKLSVDDIFKNPTLNQQALLIEKYIMEVNPNLHNPISSSIQNELSSAEERLWFLQNFSKKNPFYSMPRLFHIKGKLDIKRFKLAVEKLMIKHDILLTTYTEKNGYPEKIKNPIKNSTKKLVRIIQIPSLSTFTSLESKVEKIIRKPFYLSDFPLVLFIIFKQSINEWYFLLNIHHIICDNWSLNILLNDLSYFYNNPNKLTKESRFSYANYTLGQKQFENHDNYKSILKSFSEKLATYPDTIKLPLDFKRPAIQKYKGALYHFLVKHQYIGLKKAHRQLNATMFSLLFSGFSLLIKQYSMQEKFIIGTTIANRFQGQYQDTVGLMANTVPVPCYIKDNDSILEIIAKINKKLTHLSSYYDLPFEKLVQALNTERRLDRSPIFQVAFVMLMKPEDNLKLDKAKIKKIKLDPKVTKFDLTFYVEEFDKNLSITCEYNSEIFKQKTIEQLSSLYISILDDIVHITQSIPNYLHENSTAYTQKIIELYRKVYIKKIQREFHDKLPVQKKLIPLIFNNRGKICPPGQPGELCIYELLRHEKELILKNNALLKTGILSCLKNGKIHFLGKSDSAASLDGNNFYLDEISFYLKKHPLVSNATVILDTSKNSRLIAYYQPKKTPTIIDDKIQNWELVYDSLYENSDKKYPKKLNIAGWNNSYDGEEFSIEEMEKWATTTAINILSYKPQHILEIGCGTGLITFKLLNNIKTYVGSDLSEQGLKILSDEIKSNNYKATSVSLVHMQAHQLEKLPKKWNFDMIVMNSVVQYFPNFYYLSNLIKNLIRHMPLKGKIYIGDIRNLDLFFSFYASIQVFQLKKSSLAAEVKNLSLKKFYCENELLIAPNFFIKLKSLIPEIENIEFKLKDLSQKNELALYRYECVLHINKKTGMSLKKIKWMTPQDVYNENYRNFLKKSPIGFKDIQIPQLEDIKALEDFILENPTKKISSFRKNKVNYVAYKQISLLAKNNQCKMELRPSVSGKTGFADIIIALQEINISDFYGYNSDNLMGNIELYSNDPDLATRPTLARELMNHLSAYLPSYMQPEIFIAIPFLKRISPYLIDQRLLPAPAITDNRENTDLYLGPKNLTEYLIEKIWCELFKKNKVSINQNFFDLGGESLLAIQMIYMVNKKLHCKLSLHSIFECPTIHLLSEAIKNNSKKLDDNSPIIKLRDGDGPALFLIHPLGGTVFCYETLSKKLDIKNPIYAIQDPCLELGYSLFNTIEEIAEAYIYYIKGIQNTGPYLLAGFSSGGNYAAEIARQIILEGMEVKKVILFDSWAKFPPIYSDKTWFNKNMNKKIKEYELIHFSKFTIEKYPHFLALLRYNMAMLLEYSPQKIDCPILLFKAKDISKDFNDFDDPQNYWGKLSPRIEKHEINANHDELLTLPTLTEILSKLNFLLI